MTSQRARTAPLQDDGDEVSLSETKLACGCSQLTGDVSAPCDITEGLKHPVSVDVTSEQNGPPRLNNNKVHLCAHKLLAMCVLT